MEFKQYLKILKANIILIAIFALIGLAIALFASTKVSYSYKQSQLIYLETIADQNTPAQTFDGYYAQEKARNFTDTAVSILNSADFQSGLISQPLSIDTKKLSPQLIRITISIPNPQSQTDMLNQTVQSFNSKIKNITGSSYISAIVLSSPSPVAYSAPGKKVLAVAGLMIGFIFALCTIAAKTYFKL